MYIMNGKKKKNQRIFDKYILYYSLADVST